MENIKKHWCHDNKSERFQMKRNLLSLLEDIIIRPTNRQCRISDERNLRLTNRHSKIFQKTKLQSTGRQCRILDIRN